MYHNNKSTIIIEDRLLKQNKIEFMNIIFFFKGYSTAIKAKQRLLEIIKVIYLKKFNTILKQKYLALSYLPFNELSKE